MSTYVIFDVDIHDLTRYQKFMRQVKPALDLAGARYLARGGTHKVYEGDWTPRRIVLLEFPLQLLAASHRDPQRRHRRQRRHGTGSVVDAVYRHPMHPEYPCAHCIISGAVGTVLQAETGAGPMPTLTTTSPTAKGAARSWTHRDRFL